MSPRELQFHYFRLHDFDNNYLLDGTEIIKAIKHGYEEHGNSSTAVSLSTSSVFLRVINCFKANFEKGLGVYNRGVRMC